MQTMSTQNTKTSKQELIEKGTELMSEILEDDLRLDETETCIEFNFALVKLKHTIKRKK